MNSDHNPPKSIRESLSNIFKNLSYLIGKWLAEHTQRFTSIADCIREFVAGWLDFDSKIINQCVNL